MTRAAATETQASHCSPEKLAPSQPGTLGGVTGLFGLDPVHGFGHKLVSPLSYYYLALVLAVISVLVNLAAGVIIRRTSALSPSVGPT